MHTPSGAGAGRTASVHSVAAEALSSLLAHGEVWPPHSPPRFRNLLLDACGSDHRPLIDVLLRIGRHGLVDALRAHGAVHISEWPGRRTTLVSMVVGELFVSAEIAAWAVDAWAVALGVVPREAASSLREEYAARAATVSAERSAAPRARQEAALRPLRAAATTRGTGATYVPGAPSWAGGQPSPRVGAWVRGASGANVPRWRVPSSGTIGAGGTTLRPPNLARFFVVALSLFTLFMLVMVMLMRSSAVSRAADARGAVSRAADARGADARGMAPREPARVSSAPVVVPSDPSILPSDATTVIGDTVASGTALHPADSGDSSVDSARHARYTTPSTSGISGRYRVARRILSVNGNALCSPVAAALQRADSLSEEEFKQRAGTNLFDLVSRPGVYAALHPDGSFATVQHRGVHDGVRYRFEMIGRTTRAGFVARTITETQAYIGYRRTQHCVVQADLIGTRQ